MTQEELATAIGKSQSVISSIENRDSKKSDHSSAIARALNVSVDWLETGEGPKERQDHRTPVPTLDADPAMTTLPDVGASPSAQALARDIAIWSSTGDLTDEKIAAVRALLAPGRKNEKDYRNDYPNLEPDTDD